MIKKWITILAVFIVMVAPAQAQGINVGDAVPPGSQAKALNYSSPSASIGSFRSRLTIVDFFGTWCLPCLKALPHLKTLKEKFGSDLGVVLVSNESEAQLTKFIAGRPGFAFPVLVDEKSEWNNLFQPPSLPYTAVVNEEGKVVALTDAASITETSIQEWLKGNAQKISANAVRPSAQPTNNTMKKSNNPVVQLSQDYIYKAKTGENLSVISEQLKNTDFAALQANLKTDNERKAFWINIYNGYTQAALKAAPEKYQNRTAFFKEKAINVGGEIFSLDEIEHGILRHSKIKWSLGHLNKLFPSKREKSLRVDTLDYRLHFALNCGAKSCPPIAFYNAENLDTQLNLATKAYLTSEVEYDSAKNVVRLPKLMSWFRADFGGKKGMITILRKHGIIAADASPKIKFKEYDWTITLNNYTTQNP